MKIKHFSTALFSLLFFAFANAQGLKITRQSFSVINLNYPGLEKVNQAFSAGKYEEAAQNLLDYYRKINAQKHPDYSITEQSVNIEKPLPKGIKEEADKALLHQFEPHKGYGYFDYGKDINWQLWPVKDNEVRWQLHRVGWWQAMGLAYLKTRGEKYAKEWILQFLDWEKKNPLGLSKDNDKYAWRPLEVSDRVQSLTGTFTLFVNSPNFTPAFLLDFLNCYHTQANYLLNNFTLIGNHRLFETQRLLVGGALFPEFKDAKNWRKNSIDILNTEIKKQVYPDGMQFELSPTYHIASINIFLAAYQAARNAGIENEFPASFKNTIEKMIMATINFSFPDYTYPMFGDAWWVSKSSQLKLYKRWATAFPDNDIIKYFASDHKEGKQPPYLSKGLTTAGFYTFRNGWNNNATVMVLKASPPGEFHAQPDNGTFELWIKGRDFTPDAGTYVYSGDAKINKLREDFRRTSVHQTLTLDDSNMIITKATLNKWASDKNLTVLTYTNPSYRHLNHQRTVLFIDQKFFLIIDAAIGSDTGRLDVRYALKEDSHPVYDVPNNRVYTTYTDSNNLLIQNLNEDKINLKEEHGEVSYKYREEMPRPLFAFEKKKSNEQPQYFISILYPFHTSEAPKISLQKNAGNDWTTGNIDVTLTINGKKQIVKTQIK